MVVVVFWKLWFKIGAPAARLHLHCGGSMHTAECPLAACRQNVDLILAFV